ncbi:MAG: DMT family transporter [Muribaculaceae bacterium]|nr:DMT family transporter [Muribaculaceae bacterium]
MLKIYKTKSQKAMILGHIGAIITVGIWGGSFVSTKVLLDNNMNPAEIYVYRFILAYLLVLLMSHSRLWANSLRDELLFALCGITGGSIYFLAENTALEYTLTTNVSLLTSTSPLITSLLVGLIYKSERPSRGMLVGSLIAFMGVGCVIFNSSFNLQIRPLGDILSILAAFSWAVYSLVLRKLNVIYDLWFITRKTFFYGVLTAIPFVLSEPLNNPVDIISNHAVLGNLLFLGIGASMMAYYFWAMIIKQVGAVKANNYMYLQSIFTLIISAIVIHEHISAVGIFGCCMILGGLWVGDRLSQSWRKKD